MFKNYLLSGFRGVAKNPLFSLINIGGLALGLAVCTLVYLYVQREMNFDTWVESPEDIYRVEVNYHNSNWGYGYMSNIQVPLKPEMKFNFPEVDLATLVDSEIISIKRNNVVFFERVTSVSPEFFEMFSLRYISGDATTAAPDMSTIALSRSVAKKYFGEENPVGQIITMGGDREMRVGAVYEDLPDATHMPGDAYIMFDMNRYDWYNEWNSNSPWLYIQVNNPNNLPTIESKLYDLITKHKPFMDEDEENPNDQFTYFLQPFNDIHLKSVGRTGSNPYGNLAFIYGYIAIATLILGISCVNYINLSTARASKRTKEVCMRKVLGAGRNNLMAQFMGETIILALMALVAAIGLTLIAMPWFEQVVGGELALDLTDPKLWLLFAGLVSFCGLIGGTYPALFVSRFRPSKFLHSNKSEKNASSRLRGLLVVMQFSVSIGLIASATIIYKQMDYVNTMDLGFNRDNMVVLRGLNRPLTTDGAEALKAELERVNGVMSVARAYNAPGDGRYSGRDAYLEGANPEDGPGFRIIPSDTEFLATLNVPIIAGRHLSNDYQLDQVTRERLAENEGPISLNVVINEAAVRDFGFENPEEILGKVIVSNISGDIVAWMTVVGVAKDFIFGSAKRGVDSMVFYDTPENLFQILIRIEPISGPEVLADINKAWESIFPDVPIRREFLDENLNDLVSGEARQNDLFLGFSAVAIALSCLGLLGLAIFTAEHRTKEIGLRKFMGASVSSIVGLLAWQFAKPMLVANLVAIPLAWYFSDRWLQSFSQRIEISPVYFAAASLTALIIGWSTIAGHTFKAARANPINALRSD